LLQNPPAPLIVHPAGDIATRALLGVLQSTKAKADVTIVLHVLGLLKDIIAHLPPKVTQKSAPAEY
jgi:hypothetical protein